MKISAVRLRLFFGLSFPLVAAVAEAGFCVGRNCGADDPSFHCHSRDTRQNECWDQFDNACESVPGFSVLAGQAAPCGLDSDVGSASGELGGGQLLTITGGHDVFRSQLRRPMVTRAEKAERKAAEDATEESDEDDDEAGPAVRFDEMTTALENESWKLFGNEGETLGARFGWMRQSEQGHRVSAAASYQKAEPDGGDASDLFHVDLGYGHTLSWGDWAEWQWGASAVFNQLDAGSSSTSYGANGQLGFYKGFDNGHQLSGGVVAQFLTGDDLDEDLKTIGIGAAYGVPIGERFAVDFELYQVSLLDASVVEDRYLTAAVLGSWYVSPRFSLTLGYRVIEGIADLDSRTFSLGSSSRFD